MIDQSKDMRSLLIIDDEPEMVKSLRRLFRKDCAVYTAESGEDGLRLISEQPVQVIITDQRMPGMTGTEFLGRVKLEHPDAIRLILTGYSDIEAVIDAINRGNVFRYVTKPWNPTELQTIVDEAFERYWLVVNNRKLFRELEEANALLENRVRERTAELADANRTLAELNAQKDRFLGMASHDLRNPLEVIRGFSELLLDEISSSLNEEHGEWLSSIHTTSCFMLKLVNNLLDVATIESGKFNLELETVDLPSLVEQQVKTNGFIASGHEVQICFTPGTGVPEVSVDREKIRQVLNNLLSNAIKFSHSGSSIDVRLEKREEQIVLSVRDQGVGISAEDMSKLFRPFSKTSKPALTGERNTGLGLVICKSIVEAHGGTIQLESEVGKGSVFSVRLPLPATQAAQP